MAQAQNYAASGKTMAQAQDHGASARPWRKRKTMAQNEAQLAS
jgi:hypothetical protein